MAIDTVIAIVRRLLADDDFRRQFFADREAVLADYSLSSVDRRWLDAITDEDSLRETAERLDIPVKGDRLEMVGPPADDEHQERVVSTGFAATNAPATPLASDIPLAPQQEYFFWLEVGAPVAGSIEERPVALPDDLPEKARLQVALFTFADSFQLQDPDMGELELQPDGTVRVFTPATTPAGLLGDSLLQQRLFFTVRAPAGAGRYQLRCNIYYRQTLLQSRLITAYVATPPPADASALRSQVDYLLTHTFNFGQLAGMGRHRLSLMLNDNEDGTHGFRFFGEDEFKNDAAMGEGELQDLIDRARRTLRQVAWGDEGEYTPQKAYRYEDPAPIAQFRPDLIRLARIGYRFYDALINRLAGGRRQAITLEQIMRRSGQVQIAMKESARLVVPAALFYDYPLDANLKENDYKLCSTFTASLQGNKPLENTACFQGNCPHSDADAVVCPSGFWGFRHELGLPVSIAGAPDAPVAILVEGPLELTVAVSLDEAFKKRPQHEQTLHTLQPNLVWHYADSRDETFDLLQSSTPHLVYFYCHGGLADGIPYLHVGPKTDRGITRDNLRAKRVFWDEPRPLVFINGCYTTALDPSHAIDLVTGFVENSFAAGVVGTEITIFETLAVQFAEECLQRFLVKRESLGAAIRGARLHLLKQKNPLGLVYIPYATAGLRLV